MAKHDLEVGRKVIRRILKQLDKPDDLEHSFAQSILDQAVRNASSKPTPQARMAAAIMEVDDATIYQRGSAGQPSVDVAIGSEFGSALWPQFHKPPTHEGYWLWPATRDPLVREQMDDQLDQMLRTAIRG